MTLKYKHICIDWDGTIVEDGAYPEAGEFKEHAVNVMKRILKEGGEIVIWTCRNGNGQEDKIIDKLVTAGIHSFNVNHPFDHYTDIFGDTARKVFADVYIDDRNLGVVIDWYEIEKKLFE